MVEAGIRVCLMQNSHITTVTRQVEKWHHLKHFMDKSVEHRFIGIRPEKVKFLVQKFSKKQKSKYILSEII
jgi:hypothetical protein